MKKEFLKQIWVAFKIWVIALAANTLLGSLYLAGELDSFLMTAGLVIGIIFSFPLLIILYVVINECVSRRKNGLLLFQYVFIIGLGLTLISSGIFVMGFNGGHDIGLLAIALISAVAGIGSQYGALFRLADYDKHLEKFLS